MGQWRVRAGEGLKYMTGMRIRRRLGLQTGANTNETGREQNDTVLTEPLPLRADT